MFSASGVRFLKASRHFSWSTAVISSTKKENYIKILNEEGFGTKNLPDAMEWHCTYFWDHALNQEQITHSKITKELLEKAIAIPISLNKSIENYSNLGKKLFT